MDNGRKTALINIMK